MATAMYGKAREAFANGEIDWIDDAIKVVLVDTDTYTVSIDTDEFLDDIASGAQLAVSGALASKTNVLGVLDADDVVFEGVDQVSTEKIGGLVLFKDTGTASTSPLIAHIDNAPQLPVTPNGSDITIVWDNGANKILKI